MYYKLPKRSVGSDGVRARDTDTLRPVLFFILYTHLREQPTYVLTRLVPATIIRTILRLPFELPSSSSALTLESKTAQGLYFSEGKGKPE